MKKKDYKITPKEFSFGTSFHVEVWDEYGNYCGVYEQSREDAWKFIYDYWSKSEENQRHKESLSKAIQSCIKLDKEAGILTGNRDGLD
tara:strand:+ start:324 stop:587 length:264 start_codon:yes stop_codon:yes gene_type:complete